MATAEEIMSVEPIANQLRPALNPYPGLRPFEAEHEMFFFGRDQQVEEVVQRLRANHFAAILGGSGCGKSSLILAGVLPELLTGGLGSSASAWIPIVFRPEESPIVNLAREFAAHLDTTDEGRPALEDICSLLKQRDGLSELVRVFRKFGAINSPDKALREQASLLVVVDQFEEIFRPTNRGSREVQALVNLVLDVFSNPHANVYVILTMRSEDLHSCAGFLGLPEALNRSCYLVPRLRDSQLKEVIIKPAERFAFRDRKRLVFDEDVWAEIIEETLPLKDDPDHLPLLQHLLHHLWAAALKLEGKEQGDVPSRITKAALISAVSPTDVTNEQDDLLSRCLHNRAEDVYQALDDTLRPVAKRMFIMMGLVDSNGVFKRNFVSREEIELATGASPDSVAQVIDAFASGHKYIRVGHAGKLDVAHEAFIRKWDRFSGWVRDDHERAVQFGTVFSDYKRWQEALDSHPDSLWRRIVRSWPALLSAQDLRRLRLRSLSTVTWSELERWTARLGMSPPGTEEELQSWRRQVFHQLARFLKFSRRKVRTTRIVVRTGGALLAVMAIFLVLGGIERDLRNRQIWLPMVESAMSESFGFLGQPGGENPVDFRMARLAELSRAAKDLDGLMFEPGLLVSRGARDQYFITEGWAQKNSFSSLSNALTQYLWQAPTGEGAPQVVRSESPSCNLLPEDNRGKLFQASDGRLLFVGEDLSSVAAMAVRPGTNDCQRVLQFTFPPGSVAKPDPDLRVLVVRVPSLPGGEFQWNAYLLKPQYVELKGFPEVVRVRVSAVGNPAVTWNEEALDRLGPNWDVSYRAIPDNQFEVSVVDGVAAHTRTLRHVSERLERREQRDDAIWDNRAENWQPLGDVSQPFCGLRTATDSRNYCVTIEAHPEGLDPNYPGNLGSPGPGGDQYAVRFFLRDSPETSVAAIAYFGPTPSGLAVGTGPNEGWFRIVGGGVEYSGIWTLKPLVKTADFIVRAWAGDECPNWQKMREHPGLSYENLRKQRPFVSENRFQAAMGTDSTQEEPEVLEGEPPTCRGAASP